MPNLDINDILDRFERMEERASKERGSQTAAFGTALDKQNAVNERGFRTLARAVYGIVVLLVLGVLTLAGVQVTYGGARPASLAVEASAGAEAPTAGAIAVRSAGPAEEPNPAAGADHGEGALLTAPRMEE